MPAMLRPNKKAEKIAFKILGVPANLQIRKDEHWKKINKQLVWQETARIR